MVLSKGRSPASKGTCVVYFLRLRSGALYIGASEDIEQQIDDHKSGHMRGDLASLPALSRGHGSRSRSPAGSGPDQTVAPTVRPATASSRARV